MKNSKFVVSNFEQYLNEKKINEASFYDFNTNSILTDKYIKDFIKSKDDSDDLLYYFIQSEGLDDDDIDGIRLSKEFFEFIKSELETHLNDAINNIEDNIDYETDNITIYRAITVDDNWLQHLKKQGKGLGICWSYDENRAEAYWADSSKNNLAVIEAEINQKYIDWNITFELNSHPSFHEEKEIRLFKNTPIEIKSITINDNIVDISELGSKTFYS